ATATATATARATATATAIAVATATATAPATAMRMPRFPTVWRRGMKFRKKPIEIEAWQNGSGEPQRLWFIRAVVSGTIIVNEDYTMTIKTLEGDHLAQPNDWIIRGVKGELYPCKPDIFEATYEAVES